MTPGMAFDGESDRRTRGVVASVGRVWAIFVKEILQLRRDRITFATMIFIPLVQLLLFGYAINTNPRHLPTAVLVHDDSAFARSFLSAMRASDYFDIAVAADNERELDRLILSGRVQFGVQIPAHFGRDLLRGERPALLVAALSVTREIERGTMESLLAMPIRPVEIMLGKIGPYVVVGGLQTALILVAARILFDVPVIGSLALLIGLTMLFIVANLSVGYTFSTIATNQLQAMQMSFFFFLPNMLLSGFMFPFRGMPDWAQVVGEVLPLTHYLRIIRGIMLKGAGFADVQTDVLAMGAFTLVAMGIAVARFRQTLD